MKLNIQVHLGILHFDPLKRFIMKITEFLQKAQYSRLSVGYRWMFADAYGYTVCERLPRKRATTILASEITEDEAVRLLIEGEELYSDLLKNINNTL
jgi:hypothetical protein